ncbi:MAG TPA: hypothetical protein VFA89_14740 [Terriglobales bacterium]|nr:hypothetical protein [Terriglobales bacterium]
MRKFSLLAIMISIATIALAQKPNHHNQCSNRSAVGRYGYNCSGVAPNPFDSFATEPFAAYGMVTSDGTGQWNGYGKVSFNGNVQPWTHNTRLDGPSVVNSDCTGNVTYVVTVGGNPVPDAHFDFVITADGAKVEGFPTDAGYAVTCHLEAERHD